MIPLPLRAAVFDFDGVIVDSEPLHFRSLQQALSADGVTITADEYWGALLAYDDRSAIRLALEMHAEATAPERIARIEQRKAGLFGELVPEVPVFEGASELIRALAERMPLAIASGARHEEIELILSGLGLREAFGPIVGAEDAERTKPDPAPYREAARQLSAATPGLSPADCIAFEDSPPGIAAALGAGMKVVGVAHTYPADKLRSAHRVVGSLVGLTPAALGELFP